jgi:3-deoxy-7-phosphoheptulonate synthase
MEVPLPPPNHFRKKFPSTNTDSIASHRKTIQDILQGRDPRALLVVGPCSVHHYKSFLEYAYQLKELAQQVQDHFFVVIRAYVEKPRSTIGWKGFLYDPDLDGSHDIEKGIALTRSLYSELTRLGLPIATEILDLNMAPYLQDFISWGSIGARTSSSSPHRYFASSLPFPIGFKNSVDGNLQTALYGVQVAQTPHTFPQINNEGKLVVTRSEGNPWGHVILRGSLSAPNYSKESIQHYYEKAASLGSPPPLLIDCSHDNSRKLAQFQIPVFQTACQHFKKRLTKGMMLESYLKEGSQPNSFPYAKDQSITDPCLSWEQTLELVSTEAKNLFSTTLIYL